MNLKLRFALLFTICVAIILLISSLTIDLLYYNNRETDFYNHLKSRGIQINNIALKLSDTANTKIDLVHSIPNKKLLNDETVFILDTSGNLLRAWPETAQIGKIKNKFAEIIQKKELNWNSKDKYQHTGFYENATERIVISSGYDVSGFQKLAHLQWILLLVFAGGLCLTALVSFLFVRQALLPLTRLSTQMQNTNLHNLKQRIEVFNTKDEISDIARNFNSMLERLNGAFDFQKSFVYHASHELRTPLATMLSQTESALSKYLSVEQYVAVLRSLKEEQQELIDLTNSMLLISQYDNMEYIKDWPIIRVDEVLYDTVGAAKRLFPNLDVNIHFGTIPENDDEFSIKGNEALLKSAFINLFKNAYLYSIDKKIGITLESDNGTIFIHFENKGTQLPADEKDRIMTPFFRGGNALKTKGYGLGLSIVDRFISIHKGTVTYTPVHNDSNRFTITLENVLPKEMRHKKSQSV